MQNKETQATQSLSKAVRRLRTPRYAAGGAKKCCVPTTNEHGSVSRSVDPALRIQRIAQTAYFLAERRGFSNGEELRDWLQAEKEVDGVYEGLHFSGD